MKLKKRFLGAAVAAIAALAMTGCSDVNDPMPSAPSDLERAAAAARVALSGLAVSNETSADDVLDAAETAARTVNAGIEAAWSLENGFELEPADVGIPGRISGDIALTLDGETATVAVDLAIAALHGPGFCEVCERDPCECQDLVNEAAALAQEAVDDISLAGKSADDADEIEALIMDAVEEAIEDIHPGIEAAWSVPFQIAGPSITGTVELTLGEASADVTVSLLLPAAQGTKTFDIGFEHFIPPDVENDADDNAANAGTFTLSRSAVTEIIALTAPATHDITEWMLNGESADSVDGASVDAGAGTLTLGTAFLIGNIGGNSLSVTVQNRETLAEYTVRFTVIVE